MNFDMKKTKILCTIGPASDNLQILKKMCKYGMNAIRINTAHGTFNSYESIINKIRRIADIPIIMDIKGPDLRIRTKTKQKFEAYENIEIGFNENSKIFLNNKLSISMGDVILVNDGRYKFKVIKSTKTGFIMKSSKESLIEPDKNVNIPYKKLKLPLFNKRDIKAINFVKKKSIEFIAQSYCSSASDIKALRNKIIGTNIKIIAKIENQESIKNIKEIIDEADCIMVARGDLGVELHPEDVPMMQKMIIRTCNKKGKPVIVATQMLESMVSNSFPTRAETSDVANAVLDGADCLMLSEETAIGVFPVETVRYMSKVVKKVEPKVNISHEYKKGINVSESIAYSVSSLVNSLAIDKIICLTYSGHTASEIAKLRLDKPIIAVTNFEMLKRQLMLHYSIRPICISSNFWKEPIVKTAKYLYENKQIDKKDLLLFTAGLHTKVGKKTNTIQIHKVADLIEFF